MKTINEEKINKMLLFIRSFAHEKNGAIPTLSQIMCEMGMVKSVAFRYLMVLRERGHIVYNGRGTLKLVSNSSYFKEYRSVKVPIYGSVICGSSEEEQQQSPEYLALPVEWVDGNCFLLRAKGNSMIGIGVSDGDLILVKKEYGNISDFNGKVIVALTEEGNTLKRLLIDKNVLRLHPENPEYPDIYPKSLEIQGLALKVIKQIL